MHLILYSTRFSFMYLEHKLLRNSILSFLKIVLFIPWFFFKMLSRPVKSRYLWNSLKLSFLLLVPSKEKSFVPLCSVKYNSVNSSFCSAKLTHPFIKALAVTIGKSFIASFIKKYGLRLCKEPNKLLSKVNIENNNLKVNIYRNYNY